MNMKFVTNYANLFENVLSHIKLSVFILFYSKSYVENVDLQLSLYELIALIREHGREAWTQQLVKRFSQFPLQRADHFYFGTLCGRF